MRVQRAGRQKKDSEAVALTLATADH